MFGIQRLCRFGVFWLQKLQKKITVTENANGVMGNGNRKRRVMVTGLYKRQQTSIVANEKLYYLHFSTSNEQL